MKAETASHSIIPAQPGWHFVQVAKTGDDTGGDQTLRSSGPRVPVTVHEAIPIPLVDPSGMWASPWFVRDPTGIYHYFDGGTCSDAEAAVRYALER